MCGAAICSRNFWQAGESVCRVALLEKNMIIIYIFLGLASISTFINKSGTTAVMSRACLFIYTEASSSGCRHICSSYIAANSELLNNSPGLFHGKILETLHIVINFLSRACKSKP